MTVVLSMCPVAGCGKVTSGGRCPPHAAAAATVDNRRRRRKQHAHGRNTQAWRRLRARRLELDDHRCQLRVDGGCTGAATTVHLDPRLAGDHAAASLTDLVSACRHCHGKVDGPRASLTGGGSVTAGAAACPRARPMQLDRDTDRLASVAGKRP